MFITSKNGAVYPTWNAGKRCSFQPGDLLLLVGLGFTQNPQNIACLFQTSYLCPSPKHCFSVYKTLPYERCHLEQWHYNSLSNFCYLRDRPIPKPTSYYVYLSHSPYILILNVVYTEVNSTHFYGRSPIYIVRSFKEKQPCL